MPLPADRLWNGAQQFLDGGAVIYTCQGIDKSSLGSLAPLPTAMQIGIALAPLPPFLFPLWFPFLGRVRLFWILEFSWNGGYSG